MKNDLRRGVRAAVAALLVTGMLLVFAPGASATAPMQPTSLSMLLDFQSGTMTLTWNQPDAGQVSTYEFEGRPFEEQHPDYPNLPWEPVTGQLDVAARELVLDYPELVFDLDAQIRVRAVSTDSPPSTGPWSDPLDFEIFEHHEASEEYVVDDSASELVLLTREDITNDPNDPQQPGLGLAYWPDGILGVTSAGGSQVRLSGAGSTGSETSTNKTSNIVYDGTVHGATPNPTASDPGMTGGIRPTADYASGGPSFEVDGQFFVLYHEEKYAGPAGAEYSVYYSQLGIAWWDSSQSSWVDLGTVIEPNRTFSEWQSDHTMNIDIGSGVPVVRNGFLYVYYIDRTAPPEVTGIHVARVATEELTAGLGTQEYETPPFMKYHEGTFSSPGINGASTPTLEPGLNTSFQDIVFDNCRDQYVMVLPAVHGLNPFESQLFVYTSADGLSWALDGKVFDEPNERRLYNTIVSRDATNPRVIDGAEFDLLSVEQRSRPDLWADFDLRRVPLKNTVSESSGCIESPPASPTNVASTIGASEIEVSWSHDSSPSPATDFLVEAGIVFDGQTHWFPVEYGERATGDLALKYERPVLAFDVPIQFRVTAMNGAGQVSSPSSAHSTTIPSTLSQSTRFAVDADTELASRSELESFGEPTYDGLSYWPNGLLGRVEIGPSSFAFVGGNGSTIAITSGTAFDPLAGGMVDDDSAVADLLTPAAGISAGPVLEDAGSGNQFIFYNHNRTGVGTGFYASVGVAYWDPLEAEFRDLGLVVEPNLPISSWDGSSGIEVGGGAYVLVGDYVYLYFTDPTASGGVTTTRVARAPLSALNDAVDERDEPEYAPPVFEKFQGGTTWVAGPGGDAANIVPFSELYHGFPDVARNACTGEYIMTISTTNPFDSSEHQTLITTSSDGLSWGTPELLYSTPTEERIFGTLMGAASGYKELGDSFDLLTSSSQAGTYARWTDATLRRVTISDTASNCP